jgi:hypothetical protein
MLSQNILLASGENEAPDSVIGGGTESRRVVVEATVKNGSAVKEFSFKHICGCIVETHCLVPRGNEKIITVVRESNVGDSIRWRVRQLSTRYHWCCGHVSSSFAIAS